MKVHPSLIIYVKLSATLLLPLCLCAQTSIRGTIIDEKTRVGVPYATVGLQKSNTGINADDHGKFSFLIHQNYDDTVIISSVGYQTLKMALTNIKADDTIV